MPATPGDPVTGPGAVLGGSPLAWSPDASRLFFLGSPYGDLLGVAVPGGEVGVLHAEPARGLILSSMVPGPDGLWVYVTLQATHGFGPGSGRDLLYRYPVAGGEGELLAQNVTFAPFVTPFQPVFTADGGAVAYAVAGEEVESQSLVDPVGTRDTLVIHDLTTHRRTPVAFGSPLGFSPDGDRLLFAALPCHDRAWVPNPCTTHILDLGTGIVQDLPWRQYEIRMRAWWGSLGPYTLTHGSDPAIAATGGWLLRNHDTGEARMVDVWLVNAAIEHAADGSLLGAWVPVPDGLELRILDLVADERVVAATHPPASMGALAFSRDGRRVAYVADDQIFVKALPAHW